VHPAARQVSRSPFRAEAVKAMIGVAGRLTEASQARMVRVAVNPSITGICRSISTRS